MKEILINRPKYSQYKVKVDDEDYQYLNQFSWTLTPNKKYARRFEFIKGSSNKNRKFGAKRSILMHREILGLKKGDGIITDHINHDGLDNQKSNLRKCNAAENSRNCTSYKNSTSKYLGVFLFKCKRIIKTTGKEKTFYYWRASIQNGSKKEYIGDFKSEDEAAKAYNEKAIIYYKEFANLNQITTPA